MSVCVRHSWLFAAIHCLCVSDTAGCLLQYNVCVCPTQLAVCCNTMSVKLSGFHRLVVVARVVSVVAAAAIVAAAAVVFSCLTFQQNNH